MRKFRLLIVLLILILPCCSEQESTDIVKSFISVAPKSISLPANEGSFSLEVKSNSEWIAMGVPSWLDLPVGSGVENKTLEVIYEQNTNKSQGREAIITFQIKGESKSAIVEITQAIASDLYIDKESMSLTAQEGVFVVDLVCNTDWVIEGLPSWIGANYMSGDGDKAINFTYQENPDVIQSRTATIIFKTKDGTMSASLIVEQDNNVAISLSQEAVEVGSDEGLLSLELTSNMPWTVIEVPDWISVSPMSADGDAAVQVRYNENTDIENDREFDLIFKMNEADQSAKLNISQSKKLQLLLSSTSISVGALAGTNNLSVEANMAWQTSGVPDWIKLSSASGEGDQDLVIEYEENIVRSPRNAVIVFTGGNLKQELSVEQMASQRYILEVTSTNTSMPIMGGVININVESNADWTIDNTASWVTLDKLSGSLDGIVEATVANNNTSEMREAILVFRSGDSLVELKISQDFSQLNDLEEEQL